MTAKEYLNQYHDALVEIETLTEEVQRLRSLAEKITVAFDSDGSAPGTRKTDKIEECVERIMESEEKIKARAEELAKIRQEVYDTIAKVQDSKLRTLLFMRYIGNKSFENISITMGYTYNHILKNIHPQALMEVSKILKESM